MRALVVGATGFLGSAVAATFDADGANVTGTGRSPTPDDPRASVAFDFFTDAPGNLLAQTDPDVVVFAATVERDQSADRHLTTFGAAADDLTRAVEDYGCRLLYVSSDAVFDGEDGNYAPDDRRNPVSAYGRRTVRFEDSVKATCTDACIVRPSYQYGVAPAGLDHRLAAARDALAAGRTYTRFSDMYRSPVSVREAARAVVDVAASSFQEAVHLGGPRTSVYEFHRDALDALCVDTSRLVPEPTAGDHPMDRSLDVDGLERLLGWRPSSVEDALADVDPGTAFSPLS